MRKREMTVGKVKKLKPLPPGMTLDHLEPKCQPSGLPKNKSCLDGSEEVWWKIKSSEEKILYPSGEETEKEDSSWPALPGTIGSSWSKLPVGRNLVNRTQNCPESGDAEPPGKTLPGNNETGSRWSRSMIIVAMLMIPMCAAGNTLLRSRTASDSAANSADRGFVNFHRGRFPTNTSLHLHQIPDRCSSLLWSGRKLWHFPSKSKAGNASWWFGVLITAELILTRRNSRPTAARQISQIRGSSRSSRCSCCTSNPPVLWMGGQLVPQVRFQKSAEAVFVFPFELAALRIPAKWSRSYQLTPWKSSATLTFSFLLNQLVFWIQFCPEYSFPLTTDYVGESQTTELL